MWKRVSEEIKKCQRPESVFVSVCVREREESAVIETANGERTLNTFVLVQLFCLYSGSLECARVSACMGARLCFWCFVYLQHVFVAAASVSIQNRNLIVWASLAASDADDDIQMYVSMSVCTSICSPQANACLESTNDWNTHLHRRTNTLRVAPLTTTQLRTNDIKRLL